MTQAIHITSEETEETASGRMYSTVHASSQNNATHAPSQKQLFQSKLCHEAQELVSYPPKRFEYGRHYK